MRPLASRDWRRARLQSLAALIACVWLSPVAASAQLQPSSLDAYVAGVEAYAAGRDAEAVALLARAIAERPSDPRPYYFRALCSMRLGQTEQARADLMAGSQLEARHPDAVDVAQALQQVVGPDRRLIEFYRYRAQTGESFDSSFDAATGAPISGNVAVLRHKVSVPLDQLVQPVGLHDWLAKPGVSNLSDDAAQSAVSTHLSSEAAPSTPASLNDPFADDPLPATSTASELDVAAAARDEEPSQGKVPAGTLLGILGRVVQQTVPTPSAVGLRERLQSVVPQMPGGPADAMETGQPLPETPTDDAETVDEDPLGGF